VVEIIKYFLTFRFDLKDVLALLYNIRSFIVGTLVPLLYPMNSFNYFVITTFTFVNCLWIQNYMTLIF